jgi:hypothetical protein
MEKLACKALILLVLGLGACGDDRQLRLEYQSLGPTAPDLILVATKAVQASSLAWSSDLKGLSGFSAFMASEASFIANIGQCSEGDGDSCLALGIAFGQLFGSQEIGLDQPELALVPDINLERNGSLYVFFFFNAFNPNADIRCFQWRELEVQNAQIKWKGSSTGFENRLSLILPAIPNESCFNFVQSSR